MPNQPRIKTFALGNPADFDGDCFEVADRAMRQVGAVAGILATSIEEARPMVGNAEMERQIYATGEADIKAFDAGPQARTLDKMLADAEATVKRAALLAKAAGYDPKHPPKE